MTEKISHDIQFLSEHLNYESKIQHYTEKRSADTYIITLTDSLSENQFLKNDIHENYFETETMQNDLILILLILLML